LPEFFENFAGMSSEPALASEGPDLKHCYGAPLSGV